MEPFPRGREKPIKRERSDGSQGDKAGGQKRKSHPTKGRSISGKRQKQFEEQLFYQKMAQEEEAASLSSEPKKARYLAFQALKEGMKVLAVVQEIHRYEILVSLPNSLYAYVDITEISDSLTHQMANQDPNKPRRVNLCKMVSVGQFVSCVVLKVKGQQGKHSSRAIVLSMRESVVNAGVGLDCIKSKGLVFGSIKSKEEHGFVVSFGIDKTAGVLLHEDAEKFRHASYRPIRIGQPHFFFIQSKKSDSLFVVSLDKDEVKNAVTKNSSFDSLHSIRPGVLLTGKIAQVFEDSGLWVRFGGFFSGTIDLTHIYPVVTLDDLPKKFKKGATIQARVLFVDAENQWIGLTMLPTAMQLYTTSFVTRIGYKDEAALVKRVQKDQVTLILSTGETAHALGSRITDNKKKKVSTQFTAGDAVRCRVYQQNFLDHDLLVTLKESELDVPILTYADVIPGERIQGTVQFIWKEAIGIDLGHGLKATCPKFHWSDIQISDPSKFKIGSKYNFLVLSCNTATRTVLLSHKKTMLNSPYPIISKFSQFVKGMLVHGFITKILPNGVVLSFCGLSAVVPLGELADHPIEDPQKVYKIGQVMLAVVKKVYQDKSLALLSFKLPTASEKQKRGKKEEGLEDYIDPKALKHGQVLPGRIHRVVLNEGLYIHLTRTLAGRVTLFEMNDEFIEHPTDFFLGHEQEIRKFVFLSYNEKTKHVDLSIRPSLLKNAEAGLPLPVVPFPKEGDLIKGYVSSVSTEKKMVYLNTLGPYTGSIFFNKLSDTPIADPVKAFPKGTFVEGRVALSDPEKKKLRITLRKSIVHGKKLTVKDVQPGMKFDGLIKNFTDFGLFIRIKGTELNGLCHITEIRDDKSLLGKKKEDLAQLFQRNQKVRVVVLRTNPEKNQLSLSLKPSHFVDEMKEEEEEDQSSSSSSEEEQQQQMEGHDNEESDVESMEQDGEEDESMDEEADEDLVELTKDSTPFQTEDVNMFGLDWGAPPNPERHGGSDDSSQEEDHHNKNQMQVESKKPKKKGKKNQDEDEEDNEGNGGTPASSDDFEKLLLQSPNSSFLWVQYMAFWIGSMNIVKAREIGQRALKRIDPQMPQEKLNIWIALLNMEFSYGDDDSQKKVFQDALLQNNQKQIYLNMIKIHLKAGNMDKVDELYQVLIKKFKTTKSVWVQYAIHLLKHDQPTEARALLQRSLKSLPQRKHVETICKFGQIEYQFGKVEIGRTIFEDLLSTYPKRLDVWNIYIDQESKAGNINHVREIFKRACSLNLSTKKMKFVFKKFLQFEQDHGDENSVSQVKQRAMKYVESKH